MRPSVAWTPRAAGRRRMDRRVSGPLESGAAVRRTVPPEETGGSARSLGPLEHDTMSGIRFTVAALIAALAPAAAMAQTGNPEAGKAKNAQCVGCHGIPGYKASFPTVYSVPMIAGQSEKYLEAALIAYRKGERSHPTMRSVAGVLSDQDIADLAAYYAGLGVPGSSTRNDGVVNK